MKTQIKHRYTGAVLFECEVPELVEARMHIKYAVEQAKLRSANLSFADLSYANLRYADLRSANLSFANLSYADLRSADLSSANLRYVDLSYANLQSTNLRYADLSYAELSYTALNYVNLSSAMLRDNSKITGTCPVITVGPIGSRSDTLMAFNTDAGLRLQTGCFFGSLDEFRAALIVAHGTNQYREEYEAALTLIEKHFTLWGG